MWFDSWGRISIAELNEANIVSHTESCLSFYGSIIKKMLSRRGTLTWVNTYHPLEVAISGVESFESALDFSKDIGRINSKNSDFLIAKEKIAAFFSQTYFNRKISLKLHDLKKNTKLSKIKMDILDTALVSYNESFYNKQLQKKIQNTNYQLAYYEMEFLENMRDAKKTNYILLNSIKGLERVADSIKKQALENGAKFNYKYAFDFEDVTYVSLMTYCTSRSTRKYIYQSYVNLASNSTINNDHTLKKLIAWRNKKAKINGHANYTDYATCSSGLGSSETISGFLDNMKEHFEPSYIKYDDSFKKYAKDKLGYTKIFPWDRSFIKQHMNEHFKKIHDIENITIDYDKAQNKMFSIANDLFGLTFTKIQKNEIKMWDNNISCFRVEDKKGHVVGHLNFDILKRDEKPANLIYLHTVNPNLYIRKKYQPSLQTIVMHLSKGDNNNLKLEHEHALDLFHEFGHALHVILTKKQYHQCHPMAIEYDAIEFPSQWFERFALQPEILQSIAYQKNRKISKIKANALICLKKMHTPYQYWIHIMHSQIDIHLNTHFKPKGLKSFHEALAPIFLNHSQKLAKYNQFQNNQFEHFFMGSSFYGYLWAEHMIELFDSKFKNDSLAENGKKISKLLNRAAQKPFNEEFIKVVKDPYNTDLNFDFNNSFINSLN